MLIRLKCRKLNPGLTCIRRLPDLILSQDISISLRVAIDTLATATLPADKSSLEYRLVEVISKQTDPYLSLNDIWVVTKIHGTDAESIPSAQLPGIEINTRSMSILGSDGCNNYRGKIETLSGNKILFGPIMGTKKACPDMHIPNKFTSALRRGAIL